MPHILDTNSRDFTVQLLLMVNEGVLALDHVGSAKLAKMVVAADQLKARMLNVFNLNAAKPADRLQP